jgi:quercetin dioxygenase-like cupin family protein
MELPEIITRLPEAELPFPSSAVKTSVLQSERGQLVFFQILKDLDLPAHSHKGQWGTVIEGQIELTIGGETRRYGPGSSYYIPTGVVHSGRLPAGAKIIDFFEEPNRYRLK